jgi:N-acetylglucosaminyldiphosphoundecaprenol N-acetyl-beta-D-mannosaminyltransferase
MPIEPSAPAPNFDRPVHCLFGMPVDVVDFVTAEQRIRSAVATRSRCFLSTPNVNYLIACQSNEAFRNSIVNSDLSVADGMPLVWLARLIGVPLRERVAGASLFEALRHGPGKSLSIFFFGGPDGVAEAASRRLNQEANGLTCVGYESPGYGSIEDLSTECIIQRINASQADILVVSLGASKGQAWIQHNRHRLNVPVISHLGAVLHFVAGTIDRAPEWMQKSGLEWLWRIKEEPALTRRYWRDGLALLRLLTTRALPYALSLQRRKPDAYQLQRAAVELQENGHRCTLVLRGAWTWSNLAPLRESFLNACLAKKDLRLEMGGVTYLDSALVGLLMLLERHQRQQGRRFLLASLPPGIRRTLDYCGAGYLHTAPGPVQHHAMAVESSEEGPEPLLK